MGMGLLVALSAAPGQCAHAQSASTGKYESAITVYGGGLVGGSVTDATTNSTSNLDNGSSFALAVDIGLDSNSQVELLYSQQKTALTSGVFSPRSNNIGLTLHNYQIGGTNLIDRMGQRRFALVGRWANDATP